MTEDEKPKNFDMKLLKRLVKYISPYKPLIGIAVFCSLLGTVTSLYFDRKMFQVAIEKSTEVEKASDLLPYIGLFIFLPLFWCGMQFIQAMIVAWIGQNGMDRLRQDIFFKLQQLHVSYFDKHPLGKIMTRVTNDVESLNQLFSQGVVALITDFFLLTGILSYMMWLNWKLTLVMLSFMPVMLIASHYFRIYAQSAYRRTRKHLGELNGFLQENINGMRIVQVFNREDWSYNEFTEKNGALRDANIDTVKAYSVFFPLIELIVNGTVAILIYVGGREIWGDNLRLDILLLFVWWVNKFFNPIRDLTEKYNILQSALAASERIVAILDENVEIESPTEPAIIEPMQKSISFEGVWFAYNEEEYVLKDINLEVKKGERVAIVGSTGSGKTTIINLLNRFYDVNKGTISIDGVDLRSMKLDDLRNKLAIVLQDVFMFYGDIRENIRLWNEDISDESVIAAATAVNASRFIDKLPDTYKHEVRESGSTLSMGQRQLIAFARALAYDPEILILDEATSNIDTETELLIQDALEKLFAGRTSIIIAHRLSTIRNADKIIVLHHGEIQETGSHEELMKLNGFYRKLVEIQYREANLT